MEFTFVVMKSKSGAAKLLYFIRAAYYAFETEARQNITHKFSPYLKESTTLHHYKDQLVNAVLGNNRCFL
jgi:hypothetical protein